MALFKILKGDSSRLATQKAKEGFCYFTPDTGRFYIDISGDGTTDAEIGTSRIPLSGGVPAFGIATTNDNSTGSNLVFAIGADKQSDGTLVALRNNPVIYVPGATENTSGVVTASGIQYFGGDKIFTGNITIAESPLYFGENNTYYINSIGIANLNSGIFRNNTDSTSAGSGSIITYGGIGVEKSIYANGNITTQGKFVGELNNPLTINIIDNNGSNKKIVYNNKESQNFDIKVSDIFKIYTFKPEVKISEDWTDLNIGGVDLDSGSYII